MHGLEVGEPFRFITKFGVANVCFKSKDILDEVHDLDKTHLEGLRDVFMHEEPPSLGFDDIVLPNALEIIHMLPLCVHQLLFPPNILEMRPLIIL